jgi:hypothetical protein
VPAAAAVRAEAAGAPEADELGLALPTGLEAEAPELGKDVAGVLVSDGNGRVGVAGSLTVGIGTVGVGTVTGGGVGVDTVAGGVVMVATGVGTVTLGTVTLTDATDGLGSVIAPVGLAPASGTATIRPKTAAERQRIFLDMLSTTLAGVKTGANPSISHR